MQLDLFWVQAVERFALYERVRQASLVVQTGEVTACGNAMSAKGAILEWGWVLSWPAPILV